MFRNIAIPKSCKKTLRVFAMFFVVIALVMSMFLLAPASVAYADTHLVTNANDSGDGSLRQVITDAIAGDVINFSGDYTIVTAGFYINKQLTIDGVGHNVTISGNNANAIFYIDTSTGYAWLSNLTIINGKSTGGGGGAIWNAAGHLYVTNCTFSGNSAEQGGAISNGSGKTLQVTGSTFTGNSATGGTSSDGGAIFGLGLVSVTNSTFTGNSAAHYGGALYAVYSITNSTIVSNTASTSGGAIYNVSSARIAINTIIANNTGGDCAGIAFSGSSTNNLSSDGTCSVGFTQSSSIHLGTLGNYGGNTQTIPLLPNSAAIDAGNAGSCPAQDQRGVDRVGTCDIGAFESSGFSFDNQSGTPQSTSINTEFATPLGLTVTANNAVEPVIGGTVTFTAPLSGASTNPVTNIATIAGGGTVAQSVTANGFAGDPYDVIASSLGVTTTLSYELTNTSFCFLPFVIR